jgi:hypothetical protein
MNCNKYIIDKIQKAYCLIAVGLLLFCRSKTSETCAWRRPCQGHPVGRCMIPKIGINDKGTGYALVSLLLNKLSKYPYKEQKGLCYGIVIFCKYENTYIT